jgi:hypothetical protein
MAKLDETLAEVKDVQKDIKAMCDFFSEPAKQIFWPSRNTMTMANVSF